MKKVVTLPRLSESAWAEMRSQSCSVSVLFCAKRSMRTIDVVEMGVRRSSLCTMSQHRVVGSAPARSFARLALPPRALTALPPRKYTGLSSYCAEMAARDNCASDATVRHGRRTKTHAKMPHLWAPSRRRCGGGGAAAPYERATQHGSSLLLSTRPCRGDPLEHAHAGARVALAREWSAFVTLRPQLTLPRHHVRGWFRGGLSRVRVSAWCVFSRRACGGRMRSRRCDTSATWETEPCALVRRVVVGKQQGGRTMRERRFGGFVTHCIAEPGDRNFRPCPW